MILVCGEALVDLVPVAGAAEPTYVARNGGSPYNVAIGLARLGVATAYFGRLSRDAFGRMLRDGLGGEGVDCRLVLDGDEPTTLAVVDFESGPEPHFDFHGEGTADRLIRAADLPPGLPAAVTALHFGSISLVREPGASAYAELMRREHGRRLISLDPNVRPGLVGERAAYIARLEAWVALADLVKVSRADLAWAYPDRAVDEVARAWLARGPATVVVTQGAHGAFALCPGGRADVPGEPVAVADAVGAGDSFTSGLLAGLGEVGRLDRESVRRIAPDELRAILAFANAAAAVTCTRPGAQPPTRAEMSARRSA